MRLTHPGIHLWSVIACLSLSAGSVWATDDPADTVRAFNESITAGDTETAVAQLAGGGVQFTLRSQHEGALPDKLVTPIGAYWAMIIPVILASTSDYVRAVEVLSSESHGDVATVWTQTHTASQRLGSDAADENDFTEAYLLVATSDGWKIAAIADNRQATNIDATTSD